MSEADLVLSIEAASPYRAGYPMFVAVTIDNRLPQRTYFALPEVDPFTVPPPVRFVLTADGESEGQELPWGMAVGEHGPEGMRLGPAQARRMLFDLSELHPTLRAGTYTLAATYMAKATEASDRVRIEVELPDDDEATAVARLRASNAAGEASWKAFLLENFREIEADELAEISDDGRTRLRWVLALHRAIYGPLGVDRLPLAMFEGIDGEVLAGEAAVLRHELLAARHDPTADAVAHAIVDAWPGFAWRIDEHRRGDGRIATLRRLAGAERTMPPPPLVLPYAGGG